MTKVKMYFLYGIICLSALTGVQSAQGQSKEAYNWYFGDYVGMTWNSTQTIGGLSGLPTPLPASAMIVLNNQLEGVFGMSDADGNLLFYSNGMTVWNKDHQVMRNGSGLTGSSSSAQSGIVIPYPGQPRKYIAITIGLNIDLGLNTKNTLACSIIDMEGEGGLGEVMDSYNGIAKNTLLTGALGIVGESVAAVRHANGKDYWIVAPGKGVGAASALNVWKVTSSGIQTVVSYPLPVKTESDASINGYLRFSSDGKYFAWSEFTPNNLFFGEFNPSTGTFPTIKVMNAGYTVYGLEFSPSKEILYATNYYSTYIYAYPFEDLLVAADPESVPYRNVPTGAAKNLAALQLGPDGRIYSPVYGTTTMLVIDNVDDYNGFTTRTVNGLLPTGNGYQALAGLPNYMSHYFAPIENVCSYFTDDLWYFGRGGGGIAFNDAGDGTKVATAAGGESLVNSDENSLSVSSPGCGSSLIFYSQHNQLYNAKHQPMADGNFSGDESVADGLAACYIGDNKYMLFSVTSAYERGTTMGLQYHIIDMNEDNGYGRRISSTTLEPSGMAESVELAPVPGTSNEYWLIYNMVSPNEIRVCKITGSAIGAPESSALSMSGHGVSGKSYIFRANSTYDRFVLTYPDDNKMALFKFDVNNGVISLDKVKSAPFGSSGIYGAEFSPNGKYIYCTQFQDGCKISQYDIASDAFTTPFSYGDDASSGSLKLGPDGRLYVKRQGRYMGVIANPNAPLTPSGYMQNGFDLGDGIFSDGIAFSTGLTSPAVCPSGLMNEAPVASNDSVIISLNKPAVCLNVMRNDTDPNSGDSLNIVNVFFPDAADANKVDVSFQPKDSTICITAKAAARTGDVVRLIYTVRDDANPIHLCANATVTVRFFNYPDNISDAECYVDPPASAWSFKELDASTQIVNTLGMIHAGDIDDDGHVEILALAAGGAYDNVSTLYAFDDNLDVEYTIDLGAGVNVISNAISIADVNKDGKAEIFACSADGYLRKYSFDGANFVADGSVQHTTNSDYYYCQPMIADFDGNGVPEILVLDKIYNAQTLTLLVDGAMKGVGDLGLGSGHVTTHGSAANKNNSMISTGDIDSDGLPELLAGATAYKVSITNPSGTAGNTFTIHKQANTAGHAEVGDGATVVADMDLDGYLDVIVSRRTSGSKAAIFIWNPRTGEVMNTNVYDDLLVYPVSSNYGPFGPSVPFVGDIDGDGKPEIVIVSHNTGTDAQTSASGRVTAFDFDNGLIAEKWKIENSDYSAATGITLFDFNQDGAGELVYRDITHLHILNGVDGTPMITPVVCSSPTGAEYPVVVDYNNDGAAEIIVTGGTSTGTFNPPVNGYLRVYGSAGTKWAPARKVWNQYMYNVVNINEDLTVPAIQFNPATVLPGDDGLSGTNDDVRPYNNFLQQQTILNTKGTPLWLTPDVKFAETPVVAYHGDGDSLVISTKLTNIGNATLKAPFCIAAYKNTVAAANRMALDSSMISLDVGNIMAATVTIRNYSSYTSLTEIIVRINDKGAAAYVQQECNYGNNTFEYNPAGLPKAANDTVATLINTEVVRDVKFNDTVPAACPSPELAIAVPPAKGKASVVGEQIKYIPQTDFYGVDSLVYRLTCATDKTEAKMYIVVNKPKKDAYTGCPGTAVTVEFEAVNNVNYKWYASETASTQDGATSYTHSCAAPSEWWVEAQYKGKPVAPRLKVTVNVYPALTAVGIEKADTVCSGQIPAQLKATGSPSGGNGSYIYRWQQSSDGTAWTDTDSTDMTFTPPALTSDTYYRLNITSCTTESSNAVKIKVYPQSLVNYPDLRIRVCPDVGIINLSKYIDTFAVKSVLWKSVSPPLIDPKAGTIATNSLNEYTSVYTLTYTVVNPCLSSGVERKVYLERLKPDRMRPLRDTVVVCYKLAERLQLNQIFGIDAAGKWSFDLYATPYVTRSTSSTYSGAVIMNGKAIYEDLTPDYDYHGVLTKKVTVTYTPGDNSCLKGKSYTITIILTPDMVK